MREQIKFKYRADTIIAGCKDRLKEWEPKANSKILVDGLRDTAHLKEHVKRYRQWIHILSQRPKDEPIELDFNDIVFFFDGFPPVEKK